MRDYIITVFVVVVAMVVASSCTKENSYKSYTCVCILEANGAIDEEYGVQATDRYNAGIDCSDIESRVNKHNENSEIDGQVSCKIK